MNSQLVLIQNWIVASKMSLNHSKFTVMWFKASSRKKSVEFPDIIIDNTTLQIVTKQLYLGVIFDDYLIWNHHRTLLMFVRKCLIYLYVISKHKQVLSSNLLKLLIDPRALVFPYLNYSLPVWGASLHQNHLKKQ